MGVLIMGYYFRFSRKLLDEKHINSCLSIGGGTLSQSLLGEICQYYISDPRIWNLSKDLSNSKVQELCKKTIWEF